MAGICGTCDASGTEQHAVLTAGASRGAAGDPHQTDVRQQLRWLGQLVPALRRGRRDQAVHLRAGQGLAC